MTKVLDKCCFEIYTEDEILDRRWYLRERQKRENGIDQDFKDVPGEDPGVGWKRGKIDLWVQETAMKSGISAQDCLALTSLDDYDTLVDDLKKIKRLIIPLRDRSFERLTSKNRSRCPGSISKHCWMSS